MTKVQAYVDDKGACTVTITCEGLSIQSGIFTAEDAYLIHDELKEMSHRVGTHGDHWYVNGFAFKTVVAWIETEFARARRMPLDVRRVLTLEVG